MIDKFLEYSCNFIVNNVCNENCFYCDIPSYHNKNNFLDLELFEKYIYLYDKYRKDRICILGGEPGLLQIEQLNSILDILKKVKNNKIQFFTNGLLLEKIPDIYELYEIHYHIVDDKILSTEFINHSNILYNIILHTKNEDFLYKLYTGKYFPSNLELRYCTNIKNNIEYFDLNKSKFKNLFKQKLFSNVLCNKHTKKVSIDFPNKMLFKCCRSYTYMPKINLSEDNFIKYLSGIDLFPLTDGICKYCRMYFYYHG